MKFDIKEIVTAWFTKFNPKDEQKKLAEQRAEICNQCEHPAEGVGGIRYCDICGCVLSAKIYSPKENPCPLAKWTCDTAFFSKKRDKNRLV